MVAFTAILPAETCVTYKDRELLLLKIADISNLQ